MGRIVWGKVSSVVAARRVLKASLIGCCLWYGAAARNVNNSKNSLRVVQLHARSYK